MTHADQIITVIDRYDATDRETIMDNINRYVMPRIHESRMNQYDVIQLITGKSKGFVLSWHNAGVKLPLISLCKIAEATQINVHVFFAENNNKPLEIACKECDELYGKDCTATYIKAFEAQRTLNKKVVVDNLERHYTERTRERTERLRRLTGANSEYTVKSWFNRGYRSRPPIRVLCILAKDSGIDYFDWFK